jgi:lysophospholipase L1-like esterase
MMKTGFVLAAATVITLMTGCNNLSQKTMISEGRPMKIVCLGDSITGQPNLKSYLKWSFVLECMCEARMGEGNVAVLNRGIGGDASGGALQRLQGDVLDEKPDIVIILLGGNDAGAKKSRAEVKSNLETIVRKCKAIGAKVLLLQYHVIPNPEHPETAWAHLDDNNDLIAEVAASESVPVLDMAQPMQDAFKSSKVSELLSYKNGVAVWETKPVLQEHLVSSKDGVHLNPGGELVFARTIFKKLQSLGWLQ